MASRLSISVRKQYLLLPELVPLFSLGAVDLRTTVRDPDFTSGSGASGVAADGAPGSVCN